MLFIEVFSNVQRENPITAKHLCNLHRLKNNGRSRLLPRGKFVLWAIVGSGLGLQFALRFGGHAVGLSGDQFHHEAICGFCHRRIESVVGRKLSESISQSS